VCRRRAAIVAALWATLILLGSPASLVAHAGDATPPNPEAILARVKADLRARERPPYVVYTLVRRDAIDGIPDLSNSYTLRIWCRTIDNAALSREMFGARIVGNAQFITPTFDQPIDPGPPTADLLDVIRQTQGPPSPAPRSPPVIGAVSVAIETHYRVTYAGPDGPDDHLRLEPFRDPDRNRLTDLFVDRTTSELHRAVAHDHLYAEGRVTPERFEIVFGIYEDVPVITAIHGQTDLSALDGQNAGETLHEVNYRFENLAFPPVLPDWYFEPAQYGAHRADLPTS
jgi:hypothetical protein